MRLEDLVDRLDRVQRAHPGVGFPIAVVYKYLDDNGGYLAALIAYYAFVSLFPLLLLATTVLGFVLPGNPHLQHTLISSALKDFPVIGSQLGDPKRVGGGVTGLVIGVLVAAYGGLGVAQALQYAMNTAWHVPRIDRPNPFKARGRSLLLLSTTGLGVAATSVLSTLGTSGAGSLGVLVKVVVLSGSAVLSVAMFTVAFRIATARPLSIHDVLPGALAAAIVWQLLQAFGVTYVTHVVQNASTTNGMFALVLGLLGFLYLAATGIIVCVEVTVVRVDKLHPRGLRAPFTDHVELTAQDQRTYTRQAVAQRAKAFQRIDVSFTGPDTDNLSASEQPPDGKSPPG